MAGRPAAARHLPELPRDPVVSVIMPVRDAAATLRRAVGAVLDQQPPVHEVVLAVAPTDERTTQVANELARSDGRVRVIDNPTGRTPDALNLAIAAAQGDVIVRVDAHAVIPDGYVATAVAALRRTGVANVGGLQVPTAATGFARAVAAAMRSPFGTGGAAYRGQRHGGPVDTVYLGAFRREALETVGGFDPRFLRNQDAELNHRLRQAGYLVWLEPAMRVEYVPRGGVASLARQYWQYGRWRRLHARSHRGSLQPRQMAAPALVVGLALTAGGSLAATTPWPIVVVGGGYLVAVLLAATAASHRLVDVGPTALALTTMHLSWGIGFLVGPPRSAGPTALLDSKRHG